TGEVATVVMNTIEAEKEYTSDQQFTPPTDVFINPHTFKVTEKPSKRKECCSMPSFDIMYNNGLNQGIVSPWSLVGDAASSMTYCSNTTAAECPISGKMESWKTLKVYTFHDINVDLYKGFSMDVTVDSDSEVIIGINEAWDSAVTYNFKKGKATYEFSFTDLAYTTGYSHGIVIQNKKDPHSFEFNNIHLIRKDGICDELCSDGHKSQCRDEDHGNSKFMSVSYLILLIGILLI
ncbi:MAG: hypothetical protein MJ252_28905, partial [archaeon]|nr:hypothetical protein [archaeon]